MPYPASQQHDPTAPLSGVSARDGVRLPATISQAPARLLDPPPSGGQTPPLVLNTRRFMVEVAREQARAEHTRTAGCLVAFSWAEWPRWLEHYGPQADQHIAPQVLNILASFLHPLDIVGRRADGGFWLLLPETTVTEAVRRLDRIGHAGASTPLSYQEERLTVTPIIGLTPLTSAAHPPEELLTQAQVACQASAQRLDLVPVVYTPALRHLAAPTITWFTRWNLPMQLLVTLLCSFGIPFLVYLLLGAIGWDITPGLYAANVVFLLFTAYCILRENLAALRLVDLPPASPLPAPPATTIIAAYLPNEVETIVATLEAHQRLDYPGPLQIILAYNTPVPLPIEATLHQMASQDARLRILRVADSHSKAQNVNAALSEATGTFVGIFDADHHPAAPSLQRAWRWLAHGYDVVQGHCAIRNGDASWVARLAAIDFEVI